MTETILPPALVEQLKPAYVTPLVIKLCAEHSQDTGQLFEVGAGWMGKLRWERSKGIGFNVEEGFSAEDVDAQWSRICIFDNADHPTSCQEAMAAMMTNLQKR